jgi:23S rRNA (pseudouridine1915-N3)-methyltransferase
MRIRLIAAGTRLPAWMDAGVEEYARRFGRGLRFELRAALRDTDYVVALEVGGRSLTTPALATWLSARLAGGRDLALLVGGPEGLDRELSAQADFRWSLSPLTWPHGLVRVMVAEQLYRAHSLLRGHPYHRA